MSLLRKREDPASSTIHYRVFFAQWREDGSEQTHANANANADANANAKAKAKAKANVKGNVNANADVLAHESRRRHPGDAISFSQKRERDSGPVLTEIFFFCLVENIVF